MNIEIELKNIEQVLNEFNKNILSSSFDTYIISNFTHFNLIKKDVTLTIHGLKSKDEQEKIKNIIHEHYSHQFKVFELTDDLDDYFKITFSIIGILAIFISQQFSFFLSELFLITGWVIIWEIIYDLLFNEIKRKRKNKIYQILSTCEIIFKN